MHATSLTKDLEEEDEKEEILQRRVVSQRAMQQLVFMDGFAMPSSARDPSGSRPRSPTCPERRPNRFIVYLFVNLLSCVIVSALTHAPLCVCVIIIC